MDETCTIYKTADLIGKKWTLLIVTELYKGENKWKRYSHIKRSLPNITSKMLSTRLKELIRDGIISKNVNAKTVPITSEYALTDCGADLINILQEFKKWSLKWKGDNARCRLEDCKTCKY